MEAPIYILCLNCQEMVSSCEISKHSHGCLHAETEAKDTHQVLLSIQNKIEKLCSSLEFIISSNHLNENFYYEYIVKKGRVLQGVQEISIENIEKISKIATTVKKFASSMIKPGLILYSERLRELANEKTQLFIEILADSGCSSEIIQLLSKKFSELKKIQLEAESSIESRQNVKNLTDDLQVIDEIASQISRALTQRNSTTSVFSAEEDFDLNDMDLLNEEKKQEVKEKSNEDLQKYFYSKCLMIKFSFGPKHPSQMIQINELYKAVKDLDLPVDQWDQFIRNALSHPEKWINETVN